MFVTRLISGIILVLVSLVTIITGGAILWGTLLIVSLIGLRELYQAVKVEKEGMPLLTGVGFLGTIIYYGLLISGFQAYTMIALVFILVGMMFVYVFTYPKYHGDQVMSALFGVIYVSIMLSYIYQTRMLQDGAFIVWLIFLCSWGCDTCAYCVGVLIGKHKMAPKLSPKKSIEGAVGGVAGAVLLGGIYAAVVGPYLEADNQIWVYALICGIGALISMVGDLAASAIKRNHDIKDYGKLIPGHGGIMDRFDSVIFTAPMIYFLATLMIG